MGCRLSFISLLKHKGEALEKSKGIIKVLEVESGLPLRSIRTDGGGEYTSAEWKEFTEVVGIFWIAICYAC